MNLQHQQEQTEAARRDFEQLWHATLLPRLIALGRLPEPRLMAALRDLAWHAFKAGLKIKPAGNP